jgi:atypical dual specificity phosphatase
MLSVLVESTAFIDEQRRRPKGVVLVHCMGAIHRSPCICIAYLVRYERMSLEAATALVQAKRPAVRLRPEWEEQLRQWEARWQPPS